VKDALGFVSMGFGSGTCRTMPNLALIQDEEVHSRHMGKGAADAAPLLPLPSHS
jgi:hypothetical protein